MKLWLVAAVATVLVGAGAATLWVGTARTGAGSGNDTYAPDLARGAAIYANACASCHGADLKGQPNWREPGPNGRLPAPPHDETGHTWHHPDRVLLDVTRVGTAAFVGDGYQSDMPAFGDTYSDAELRDVLEWIKTQWPKPQRQVQAKVTAQDEAVR